MLVIRIVVKKVCCYVLSVWPCMPNCQRMQARIIAKQK
jgi:hypothetical protein